ncbi:hypothetical protein WUBG_00521 [Wuchereria bancrofti]|uniref:Uncharacterized protein n=1 Tax=Wuchereria bancrofti TaxID=6293 RepID=J9F101_WUCBA|nr:hypothetical protein WUBG_00521 [Wuchereria bancrofti]
MRKHYCGKSSLPVYFVELVQVAGRSWHTHTVFVVQIQNVAASWIADLIMITRSRLTNNFHFFYKRGVDYGAGVLFTVSSKCKDSNSNERSELDSEAIVTTTISYTDGMKNQKPGYIKFIDESFCDKSEIRSRSKLIISSIPILVLVISLHMCKRNNIFYCNLLVDSFMSKLQNQPYSILSLYTTNRKDGNAITSAADTCRRCSKEVYDAEKILAGGMVCLAAVSVLTDV